MGEFRVYYESIEQAKYYLEPCIKKAFGGTSEVTFVEISKPREDSTVAIRIAKSLAQRNPDGIVTVIHKGQEFPLAWIEFTTQVATQDHSLQGFNSFIAAGLSRIPLVRVVANRVSSSEHGGQTEYDFTQPYKLLWKEYETPSVELRWPTSDDRLSALRDASHMACPREDLGLVEVLIACMDGVKRESSAASGLIELGRSGKTEIAKAVRLNMEDVAPFVAPSNSSRIYIDPRDRLTLKFNRWDHSMDPERGMAEFFGTLTKSPLAGRLHDKKATTPLEALENLRRATGINPKKAISGSRLEITQDLLVSKLNRAGQIIAKYCDEFTIADRLGSPIITVHWDSSHFQEVSLDFNTDAITKIWPKTDLTEDDVTFVVANDMFPSNGFAVHSVSYPGAQGDFALLTGTGKALSRKYFDVIATKSTPSSTIVAITEVKGKGTPSVISPDIEAVLAWRDKDENRNNLLGRLNLNTDCKIHASVAYAAPRPSTSAARAKELDFIVLVQEDEWNVWAQLGATIEGVDVSRGKSNIPQRFQY